MYGRSFSIPMSVRTLCHTLSRRSPTRGNPVTHEGRSGNFSVVRSVASAATDWILSVKDVTSSTPGSRNANAKVIATTVAASFFLSPSLWRSRKKSGQVDTAIMIAQVKARRNGAVICKQAKSSTAIRNRAIVLSKNCPCSPFGVLSSDVVRRVSLSNAWRASCKSIAISLSHVGLSFRERARSAALTQLMGGRRRCFLTLADQFEPLLTLGLEVNVQCEI